MVHMAHMYSAQNITFYSTKFTRKSPKMCHPICLKKTPVFRHSQGLHPKKHNYLFILSQITTFVPRTCYIHNPLNVSTHSPPPPIYTQKNLTYTQLLRLNWQFLDREFTTRLHSCVNSTWLEIDDNFDITRHKSIYPFDYALSVQNNQITS